MPKLDLLDFVILLKLPKTISLTAELALLVDELRHLDGIKGNFMLSESEYLAPVVLFEKGKIASQIICLLVNWMHMIIMLVLF
ncbi:MAG TPA: hypothetical protein VJ729_07020 [Nitrososphaeraceae archaeon]|jgi:hypothetical protein|nr:hypothetical protein [Nitrososphaeraceae archaeon]